MVLDVSGKNNYGSCYVQMTWEYWQKRSYKDEWWTNRQRKEKSWYAHDKLVEADMCDKKKDRLK